MVFHHIFTALPASKFFKVMYLDDFQILVKNFLICLDKLLLPSSAELAVWFMAATMDCATA